MVVTRKPKLARIWVFFNALRRAITKTLKLTLLALFVWVAVVGGSIYAYASISDDTPSSAAIVLGAAVYGERPSPVFRERINHAITLYNQGIVERLIFTGGVGQRDEWAESETARVYAMQQGVPASAILTEVNSSDTVTNLQQAALLMEQYDLERVLIVSDPLHMRRAMTIAYDLGLDAYPAPTPTTRYRSWFSTSFFWAAETYRYSLYLWGVRRPV